MCDTALVCGFAEGKRKIDVDVIYEVVREKKKGGIFPIIDKKPGIDSGVVRELPIIRKEGGGS
jgi:hypothetical protein